MFIDLWSGMDERYLFLSSETPLRWRQIDVVRRSGTNVICTNSEGLPGFLVEYFFPNICSSRVFVVSTTVLVN
jgi:hypothetical protein